MIGRVLSVAGSDSGGGAGIQADIKTVTMLGCYAMTAITAVTVQNTRGVTAITVIPPDVIAAQIDAVCTDLFPDAVKVGMLSNAESIRAAAERLGYYRLRRIVVDPVMVSTSGHALLRPDAVQTLCAELFPLAFLITPNLPEASALLGVPVETAAEQESAAAELSAQYGTAVLVKGGHLNGPASDVLCADGEISRFETGRVLTENTHGTGCTLSSAIAAHLAKGMTLPDSIRAAKAYLTGALKTGFDIGTGNGPLLHTYEIVGEIQ